MARKKPDPKPDSPPASAGLSLDDILGRTKAPEPETDEFDAAAPDTDEQPEEPLLGDIVNTSQDTGTIPGFIMSDEPEDLDKILDQHLPKVDVPRETNPVVATQHDDLEPAKGKTVPTVGKPAKLKNGVPPRANSYGWVSRIQVTEVYKFDGQVHKAPDWIDRNWGAYDDGPTLYIPEIQQTARVGDFVVRQDVSVDATSAVSRLAIYTEQMFNQLFMPSA